MGTEVLVLHGSPGSGKSTLSRWVSEALRVSKVPNAVIDLDDLSMVYPPPGRDFARRNLAAMWPNFAAISDLKVIIPSVLASAEEASQLRAVTPSLRFIVCELTAPQDVLRKRVTSREPNEFWRGRLRAFVDLYHSRTDLADLRDFQVSTNERAVEDCAREVIEKAGWS